MARRLMRPPRLWPMKLIFSIGTPSRSLPAMAARTSSASRPAHASMPSRDLAKALALLRSTTGWVPPPPASLSRAASPAPSGSSCCGTPHSPCTSTSRCPAPAAGSGAMEGGPGSPVPAERPSAPPRPRHRGNASPRLVLLCTSAEPRALETRTRRRWPEEVARAPREKTGSGGGVGGVHGGTAELYITELQFRFSLCTKDIGTHNNNPPAARRVTSPPRPARSSSRAAGAGAPRPRPRAPCRPPWPWP